ncbi:MAG: hypothetical protein MHM6MM_000577 [Cercozoa sp. M6MM]
MLARFARLSPTLSKQQQLQARLMSISAGAAFPQVTIQTVTDGTPAPIATKDLIEQYPKLVIVSVPGAFTPTCSCAHLPGFVEKIADFETKGYKVAFTAVNDPFVMKSWFESQNVPSDILCLADGSAVLAEATGLTVDLSAHGLGVRMKRAAIVINDGEVKSVAVDDSGLKNTSADAVLELLQ